jgi:membrane-bound serine protease (ClpP class)
MGTKPPLWYTVQAIVGTIFEEVVLVVIVLWVLPYFDIHIPMWGLVVLMVGVGILSYVTYRIGRPTFFLRPRVAPETIIGNEGRVVRPLAPEGYVKVQGVLWKAVCAERELEAGDEVVVVGINRLKLIVCPKGKNIHGGSAQVV